MKQNRRKERPWRSASYPQARGEPLFNVTTEYLQDTKKEKEDEYDCISPFDELQNLKRISFKRYRRFALIVSVASIYITLILSISGFIVSFTSQSAGEFAFAADAILGSISSAMIIWRFYNSKEQLNPEKDRKACFFISLCFIATAFIMLGETIVNLVEEKKARNPDAMLEISIIGFACFTVLFIMKYWIAEKIGSTAIKADSYDSAAGGANSLGLVVSTYVYKANPRVWFLDDCVALLITAATLIYGVKLNYEVTCARKQKHSETNDNKGINVTVFKYLKVIFKGKT